MGLLVDGIWHDQWYDTKQTGGRFRRDASQFRNWVTADGSAGPSGKAGFKAEAGRYHLYVSMACPWAHRTLIMRHLKGLENIIDISIVHWLMGERGWTFEQDEIATGDRLHNFDFMHQIYTHANPVYSGRVTVPVLWDKETKTIVSNESSEIIRMFNSAFDGLEATVGDYWPEPQRDDIEKINEIIYANINNGVYRAGFATTKQAYEQAVKEVFETLDWLEERLAKQRWLVGGGMTEADIRLFATLVRFDLVYVGHFKCNLQRIADYANLWNYTKSIYQHQGIAETVHADQIKQHYYGSHKAINPTQIVPLGPKIDYAQAHDRERFPLQT